MNKRILVIVSLLLLTTTLFGLNIKLSSPLPEGTEWHRALTRMAGEWREITGGQVRVRIYPGGIAGDQEDVIRKMKIGQIDMGVFTSTALSSIVPESFVMSLPFLLETEEELDLVINEFSDNFHDDFLDKGFFVMGWSKSGWVNFFSKSKVEYPNDLKRIKLSATPNDDAMINAFKAMGFNVIPLNMNNSLMGLQSGMVDAMYTTPMAAAAYQWFGIADNMLDLKISPVIGGIVISERTWNRIPRRYHEELKASVDRLTSSFYDKTKSLEDQALRVMLDNGLTIHDGSQEKLESWRDAVGEDYPSFVGHGKMISRNTYGELRELLDGFRAQ